MGKKTTKATKAENEIIAGQRYEIAANTRAEASAMMRELRMKAFSAGLLHQTGGAIQYQRQNYLDEGKFVGIVTFNP